MSGLRASTPRVCSLPTLLAGLEAAGERTRLRLLALLGEAELTVSELVAILGQSQPRVSRHLKLLLEAGLVQRRREGSWAFFLLASSGPLAELAAAIVARMDAADSALANDRARLAEVRRDREQKAAAYFASHAERWDAIRSLHVPEETVERAILAEVGAAPLEAVLDLGTGTGRMLELLAPRAKLALGVDQSPAMLKLTRARIERSGLRNAQLRQGDIYAPPIEREEFDLVVIHQVLHYLADPARALREAARALRPGGRLLVVDFAPHDLEFLRERHAHRRLGFSQGEIEGFLREAGLEAARHVRLAPESEAAGQLTVSIWVGRDPRPLAAAPAHSNQEYAL